MNWIEDEDRNLQEEMENYQTPGLKKDKRRHFEVHNNKYGPVLSYLRSFDSPGAARAFAIEYVEKAKARYNVVHRTLPHPIIHISVEEVLCWNEGEWSCRKTRLVHEVKI